MNIVRKNKKGFTLIEIVVVLVILAILAAALIPSMIGFVNDARGKALVAEARSVYIAGQAVATEITGSNSGSTATTGAAAKADVTAEKVNVLLKPDIEISFTAAATAKIAKADFDLADGVVNKLTFDKIAGSKTYTVVLEAGKAATISSK